MSDYSPACKYTFSGQMVQFGSQCSIQSKDFKTVSNIGDPLSKKPRICGKNANHPSPKILLGPNNAMITGGGTGSFKTQLCMKFRMGCCGHGSKCLFAHGVSDLRKALPNLQKVSVSENLCRMFNSGKQCTYGNNCRFRHMSPENFKKHLGQHSESSAISIGTTRVVSSGGLKNGFKKRRLCNNWEMTGGCSYGMVCQFAHGREELEKSCGHIALASGIVRATASKPIPMGKDGTGTNHKHEAQAMHCMFKSNALKKILGIYADWIEDSHLLHC